MRVTSEEKESRSVAATARRAQIVAATVATIAELGYAQASFSRIAERAGLSSTRLISYHFAGKDDLITAVIGDVYTAIGEFVGQRVAGASDARSTLHAYIRAVVAFIDGHRAQMQALMSVFLEHRFPDRGSSYDEDDQQDTLGRVREILRAGQRSGEFRQFDTFVMASALQRSIDGLPFLLRSHPDLDLGDYAEELVTLFDLATRSGS